jgi:hypothetical protein
MALSIAATTTNKIENYTTPGDVTLARAPSRPDTSRGRSTFAVCCSSVAELAARIGSDRQRAMEERM